MEAIYKEKRDFTVCGVVGVCAMTREQFVERAFSVPTSPVSATIDLVGVPAVVRAKEDKKIANVYNNSTIAAIDGMPIVKMGRRRGFRCERCSAPDIMGLMFEESVKQEKTHYLYGGKNEDVLEKLRRNLEDRYPRIRIVGMYSPPFRPLEPEEDKRVCDEINFLHPDFIWVGIGSPKQELWMQSHRQKIRNAVMLGVGAGFDFFAGTLDKAPAWMEKTSLEWLYRLCKEPKRLWRRYLIGGCKWIVYNLQEARKKD